MLLKEARERQSAGNSGSSLFIWSHPSGPGFNQLELPCQREPLGPDSFLIFIWFPQIPKMPTHKDAAVPKKEPFGFGARARVLGSSGESPLPTFPQNESGSSGFSIPRVICFKMPEQAHRNVQCANTQKCPVHAHKNAQCASTQKCPMFKHTEMLSVQANRNALCKQTEMPVQAHRNAQCRDT